MSKLKGIIFIFVFSAFLMPIVSAEEINLSSMPLNEKVAQMVIVRGTKFDSGFTDMGVGGIFLDRLSTREEYLSAIKIYQKNSKINIFVSTDMEGYWNPFSFYKNKTFGEINDSKESYQLGEEHGKILKELGFNLDFSPVVELKNNVWPGRSFTGTKDEIRLKIESYILGLQSQGIMATAKHYPGGNLIKNPHIFRVRYGLSQEDLDVFDYAIKSNVSAIMIGHTIVSGALDSKGRQSTVSPEVISNLRKDFNGLIITDDISMLGLRLSYPISFNKIYVDLIKAGNDIILDTSKWTTSRKVERRINNVIKSIKRGEISEEQIDKSVTRILEAKGYSVVR